MEETERQMLNIEGKDYFVDEFTDGEKSTLKAIMILKDDLVKLDANLFATNAGIEKLTAHLKDSLDNKENKDAEQGQS